MLAPRAETRETGLGSTAVIREERETIKYSRHSQRVRAWVLKKEGVVEIKLFDSYQTGHGSLHPNHIYAPALSEPCFESLCSE